MRQMRPMGLMLAAAMLMGVVLALAPPRAGADVYLICPAGEVDNGRDFRPVSWKVEHSVATITRWVEGDGWKRNGRWDGWAHEPIVLEWQAHHQLWVDGVLWPLVYDSAAIGGFGFVHAHPDDIEYTWIDGDGPPREPGHWYHPHLRRIDESRPPYPRSGTDPPNPVDPSVRYYHALSLTVDLVRRDADSADNITNIYGSNAFVAFNGQNYRYVHQGGENRLAVGTTLADANVITGACTRGNVFGFETGETYLQVVVPDEDYTYLVLRWGDEYDLNADGRATVSDIFDFLAAYFASSL